MAVVNITDNVTAALQGLKAELRPTNLNRQIAFAEEDFFRKWFAARQGNKQGWKSTGFWKDAANSTHAEVLPDGVIVSISKIGVRQRFLGGDISPTGGKKYLTIPAREEAYGRRADSFPNLILAFHRVGGKVEAWGLVEAIVKSFKRGKRGKDGSLSFKKEQTGGAVMYWLVKHVCQQGDPTVIPPDDKITSVAMDTVRAAVARALRK